MNNQEAKEKFSNTMAIRSSIMWDIAVNYNYAKYFYTSSSWRGENSHWSYIQFNFFKVLVIDVAKLFVDNRNQKFNFFKLLISLETGEFRNLEIQLIRIKHYRTRLSAFTQFFDSIEEYRNKFFAHTDYMAGLNPGPLFFSQLEELINIGYELMNETTMAITGKLIHNPINKTKLTDLKLY
jgi:hypothetical protein